MKLNIKLGVSTEALLKHPTACFGLSKAVTRVSASLSFGEFYLKNTKGNVITPRDLEHVSASIWTSSKSAEDLEKLVDDPELRKAITAYSADARRLNNAIRSSLPSAKALIAKAKGKQVEPKAVTVPVLKSRTMALRSKLAEIEKKVENLCTVEIKLAPLPSLKGRFSTSGTSAPRKRPMYPRYFVASMGRSRR